MALNRLTFYIKLRILRWITQLLAWLDRRRSPTSTLTPSSRFRIPSTLSPIPGNFDLFFYHPQGYHPGTATQYPIVFVLHGGGWCVGHARHDEGYISTLTARGLFVVAVDYRLAPEHPYPTPVADCLDAILHIWNHASALHLDKHRTYITGFSVGGSMAFASLFMLWNALHQRNTPGMARVNPNILGTVTGITAFYPPMDLTRSRAERAASNPAFVALEKKPASSSRLVGDVFDRGYFWDLQTVLDKSDMCISPGLAPPDVMKGALPGRISFKLAGLDHLLAEGRAAASRLEDLGKGVDCEVVEGVPHYWDHLAKRTEGKRLRQEVYERVADEVEEDIYTWLAMYLYD